jgi:ketosteroid isomerase-like protein
MTSPAVTSTAATGTAVTSTAVTSTPTQTVQAFLDAFARHDIDAAMALTDPQVSVTVHPLGLHEAGPDALRQILADLVRGFPDLMITVGQVITTGDVVTALFKAEGTQAADYAGAINQEKHLDIDQAWRFVTGGGVITDVAAYWCQAQLYRRLAVKRYDEIAIA